MKNLGRCDIENTITALEKTLENRKIQMHNAQLQATSSSPNVVSHLLSEILNRAGGSYGPISLALEQGGEYVQHFIKKAQQHVEERLWDALRVVAVYSFGIGIFLSLRHRKSPTGENE